MIRHKMNQPGKSLGVIGLGKLSACRLQSSAPASPRKRKLSLDLLGADRTPRRSAIEASKPSSWSRLLLHQYHLYFTLAMFMHGDRTSTLVAGAKTISGSAAGGTKDAQENAKLLCIEVIKIQDINEALDRLVNKDVKYRFVIDIANSLN
ncbi:hypothetical protein B296_00036986 [Ensete ventricosum]|uniref:Uncharacterized protein n=1 Tax=Ensete ventricosum TaxID=4639 RepID=A0A426YFD0_ENSVE|nr:hypothetical protein B296_00036986 [Ensete ventricosum]